MNETAIKNGWNYSEKPHKKLGIKYAHRKTVKGIEIMTEDKVRYNENEVKIITKQGEITKTVHEIKKMFEGEILDPDMYGETTIENEMEKFRKQRQERWENC